MNKKLLTVSALTVTMALTGCANTEALEQKIATLTNKVDSLSSQVDSLKSSQQTAGKDIKEVKALAHEAAHAAERANRRIDKHNKESMSK